MTTKTNIADKEINTDKELSEGQAIIFSQIEDIAAKYSHAKKFLLEHKLGNWIEEHQKLDRAFIKDTEDFMATGILNKVRFIKEEFLAPKEPVKGEMDNAESSKSTIPPRADFAEANYRKEVVFRGDGFIATFFRWGSKNEINPENPQFGAETPIHGHALECAATSFIPKGIKEEDVTAVSQVTFDDHGKPVNIETLAISKTALRKADTRSKNEKENSIDIDNHVVFNPSPNQTGFTLHIYLTKGIGLNKEGKPDYIDISGTEKTAINMKNSPGFVDKNDGKIKRGGAIVPLSHYTQKLPFEACSTRSLEQRM